MSLTSVSSSLRYVSRSRHVDGRHAMGYIDGFLTLVSGLALRVVIDAATFHSVKLSGSLIGLWEGVVLLHYVKKGASFPDPPYLLCGIRVLVDFIVTEDIFKLVVVLLWTTMGMVLGDVMPVVWVETGLKRQWSLFRRDLTRSARVSFTERPSTMGSTSAADLTTPVIPPPPVVVKRPVPGTFPGAEWSETETGVGTAIYSDDYDDEFDEEGFEEVEEPEDEDEDSEEEGNAAIMPARRSITIIPVDNDEEEADEDYMISFTTPPANDQEEKGADEIVPANNDQAEKEAEVDNDQGEKEPKEAVPVDNGQEEAAQTAAADNNQEEKDEDSNTFALTTPPLSPLALNLNPPSILPDESQPAQPDDTTPAPLITLAPVPDDPPAPVPDDTPAPEDTPAPHDGPPPDDGPAPDDTPAAPDTTPAPEATPAPNSKQRRRNKKR